MKKRRPNSRKQSRSLKQSPKAGENCTSDSILLRSKSFQELKRKRSLRNGKQKRQYRKQEDEISLINYAFDSLESLFDVKKYPNLPEIQPLQLHEADNTISESLSPKNSEPAEPNLELHSPNQIKFLHSTSTKDCEPEFTYHQTTSEFEIPDLEEDSNFNMGDDNNTSGEEQEVDPSAEESEPAREDNQEASEPAAAEEIAKQAEAKADDGSVTTEQNEEKQGEEISEVSEIEDLVEVPTEQENDEAPEIEEVLTGVDARPPDHEIPPGLAEGVPIQLGQRSDSLLSDFPITDAELQREMAEASDRCRVLQEEIDDLRQEVAELQQKEDLTDEDRLIVDKKSEQIMSKMGELVNMTRELQRMLGLTDVSSEEFAKAFEMFPAPPHHRDVVTEEETAVDKAKVPCRDLIRSEGEKSKHKFDTHGAEESTDDDHFDLRQPEFPEDRLPRVIVCGYTEDNLPKIVVADSKRKPRIEEMQHLKNITGKLTEALDMQEKLARENAHLEGNKYKLQEALLEKDNAVDVLQRKVCGLQREMQLLMKENEQLSRQLTYINQRITNSVPCYGNQDDSPKTSPRTIASSLLQATQREYTSSNYKCYSHFQSEIAESSSACATPRNLNTAEKNLPRLGGGGGGSREAINYQDPAMYCRNPAASLRSAPAISPARGACPAEIEDKLNIYENSTKQLEQQLGSMESEVRNMKMELANVQRERQQLEQQRKLLKCTGPCAPCPCSPPPQDPSSLLTAGCPPGYEGSYQGSPPLSKMSPGIASSCSGICIDQPPGASNCLQQQLRDLREQYARLQEDYKNKLCEVSCLRTDAEKMKLETREAREAKEKAENRMIDLQERLKKFELEKNKLGGSREQMIEDKHRLMVAEQRCRESQEELEELRLTNQEYLLQLEHYRNKYLKAQETVEEQTRQLDLMEMDNARINENVTLEIGRVKNQFQEKLAELAPLPEILKQTQVKLQEAQQMRTMAERNCEDIDRELLAAKDKIGALSSQLEILRSENALLKGEHGSGSHHLEDLENKNSELRNENERLKNAISRFEEREAEHEEKLEQKMHEIIQLSSENEQVRQDAARQVARTKERCETIRRAMQEQIADMEKQLAQCRATAKAAQKDRDEIRKKMQGQINRLSESFEQSQGRIRTLQGHVNYLKTSYSNVFTAPGHGEGPTVALPSENMNVSPYDACDCNL